MLNWRRYAFAVLCAFLSSTACADFVSNLNSDDNFLALRTGPGIQFNLIRRMGPGTRLKVLKSDGNWRQVKLTDGTMGWAHSSFISTGEPAKKFNKAELVNEILQTNSGITQQSVSLSQLPSARLWIHLRRQNQVAQAQSLLDALSKGLSVADTSRSVEAKPLQVLDFGPVVGQVRFFKPEDEATAAAVAKFANSMGLNVEPVSLVEQFAKETWIEVGHLELWLP
ncbi:MAG: SH3 domain-containing protein [Rhodobacteraceae bacterium]|nr:SH3 domain-containing protein [Paracoccaceae bacterium]